MIFSDHPGDSPRAAARSAIGLCFFIAMLEGYDIQAFGVAAPHLVLELGMDKSQQGLAASIAMMGLVAGALLCGRLADRVGRRPVLLVSVLLFGAGSVWTAFVHDYSTLLVARLLTGFGFGGALPLLIAIATELSAPGRRGLTTSAMFCGMPIGGALVSLLAGLLDSRGAWHQLFLAGGILPLLLSVAIFRLLPETRPSPRGAGNPTIMGALFGRGRTIATLLFWAANFLTLLTLYLMLNWLPSLVVANGQSPSVGATAALCFNLVGAIGAICLGLAVDRFGFRWPSTCAYAGLAGMLFLLGGASQTTAILLFSAAAAFLTMATQYALYGLAPALYPREARAAGAGAAVAVGRVGSIVGPMLAGVWREAGWAPGAVFAMLVPVVLLAGLAGLLLTMVARGDLARDVAV